MTQARLQDLPSLKPPRPYPAAEVAAKVRQPVRVLALDGPGVKEWNGLHGA